MTGLSKNPRRAVELAPPAEMTSSFSGAAASIVEQDVTGLAQTVPIGVGPVIVTLSARSFSNNSTGGVIIRLYEDATQIGEAANTSGANVALPCFIRVRRNPAAGDHTYKATIKCNSAAGTPILVAQSNFPAQLHVVTC